MAKYEKAFQGDFNEVLDVCEKAILNGSVTASSEGGSDWHTGDTFVSVRVYERYSMIGSNRVSLSLTLVGKGNELFISAITAGGSQGMILKINRWGESAFLDKQVPAIEEYIG